MSKFALFNNYDDFSAWYESNSLVDFKLREHPTEGDDRAYCVLADEVDDSELSIKTGAELEAMGFLSEIEYQTKDLAENGADFGKNLISKFVQENIEDGITVSGVSGHVLGLMTKKYPIPNATFPNSLKEVLDSGTLTIAGSIIDYIVANEDLTGLDPFITVERLNEYKSEINTFLGV